MQKADLPQSLQQIGFAAFCDLEGVVIIRNENCEIFDSEYDFGADSIIYGHQNSTSEAYAGKYGWITFRSLDGAHIHSWVTGKVIREATCQMEGIRQMRCLVCGAITESKTEATGKHSYGKWQTVKKATVLETGKQEKTCTVCNHKKSKTIAKLKPTWALASENLTVKKGKKLSKKMISGLARGDSVKSWKSSKTSVVTVTGNTSGKCTLKGKKAGKSTITATLASGKRVKFTVTVK